MVACEISLEHLMKSIFDHLVFFFRSLREIFSHDKLIKKKRCDRKNVKYTTKLIKTEYKQKPLTSR